MRDIEILCEKIASALEAKNEQLFELRDLARLLHEAYSDMAIRNVLSSLLLRVKACRQKIGDLLYPHRSALGDTVTDCNQLINRIESELKHHSPTRQRYKDVVCVGYKTKLPNYKVGSELDDAQDMRKKCEDMKEAIVTARSLVDRDGRDLNNAKKRTLKVFMAPEFFFRGRHGAYDHAVVSGTEAINDLPGGVSKPKVPGLAEIMSEELGKDGYKDWLFVLGTVVAATRFSKTVCAHPGCKGTVQFKRRLLPSSIQDFKTKPICSLNPAHPIRESLIVGQVDNVALIYKEGEFHTVTKELISGIDYQNNEVTVGGNTLNVAAESWLGDSKFQDERMGGCVFTIDGITIGVEVCLDHDASKRKPSAGRLDHAGNIQLQLIPSYGMSIKQLRTIDRGIVFNVDGQTPHVEAIGGDKVIIQDNDDKLWAFSPTDASDIRKTGADKHKLSQLAGMGKGSWQAVPVVSAAAPNGSVVMYGPYRLPRI